MSPELERARSRASELFREIERRNLIRPALTEDTLTEAIYELGVSAFGTRKHWHRRLVRSGPNTRLPFAAQTPDRPIEADDIVSLDLAPVFDDWEADFGRSYVLGWDPAKHKLFDDLERVFLSCL